jgi:hypothetical protein
MIRPAALYRQPLAHIEQLLAESIAQGCRQYNGTGPIRLVFRADDIGVPSAEFSQLIAAFQRYQLPLCLATVPSWLTAHRLQQLRRVTGTDDSLWCWHQHGRMHRNYEISGKKQEFGPARTVADITSDIGKGKMRLEMLLTEAFQPFFTPPWNRCSLETLHVLRNKGFRGISRYRGAVPASEEILPDVPMNVDLHTRKEASQETSLSNLLLEIETGLASGYCGIMLHHQRMNQHAVTLLDSLLRLLATTPRISPQSFSTIIP